MKKIIVASFVLAGALGSLNASAASTDICTGPAGNATNLPTYGTAGTNFMVVAIAPKCSANVFLKGEDGAQGAFYSVGAASSKGKNTFAGTTNGGAVKAGTACSIPGGCTAAEAESARSAAATAANPT